MNRIFEQNNYTVDEGIFLSEPYYTVSDGTHSYTTGEKPELTVESLHKEMQEYLLMREDDIRQDTE